jgi:pimeloyl-ACP methyl ester carboxylesterase
MQIFFILISILFLFAKNDVKAEKVYFSSIDGLRITAEYYKIHPDTVPLIILFHQAGWSRGEYIEIAPRLNQLGFNCLAVDLRSGKTVNNIDNETFLEAKKKMKETNYLAAETDIISAVDYAIDLAGDKIILWGSSYSASLALKTAAQYQENINAVIAFSPGEYFRSFGKPVDYISKSVGYLNVATFIACAARERANCEKIFNSVPSQNKVFFAPENSGNHGSSALWNIHIDSKEYWKAVESFLDMVK